MSKLLNRFTWIISIITVILITAIDYDLFFIWLLAWWVVKFFFLSESFIKERLEFFANSLKENYLWNESLPIKNFNKIEENKINEEEILENNEVIKEIINLADQEVKNLKK